MIINIFKIIFLLFQEIRRRLYSDTIYYVLRRDLTTNADIPEPKIHLTLRKLRQEDIPKLFNVYTQGLSIKEIWERIRILRMIKSGIKTPYVAVTNDNEPCHIAWLIDSGENEKLQSFFHGAIKPLASDEVLFEYVFTLEAYRGLGIQPWRSLKFTEKSAELGARWALGYMKSTNESSLKNARRNAFEPYMIRTDKWRLFHRKTEFKLLNPGAS